MTPEPEPAALAVLNPAQLVGLAVKQGAGIDVIERLSAMMERWQAKGAKENWQRAILAFKAEVPPVIKKNVVKDRAGNQIYKFAGYDDIKAVTVPFERKHGIVTGFSFDNTTAVSLKGTLKVTVGSHTEEFIGAVPVPASGAGGVNATQLMGQAHTYLKRYLYLAAFDLLVAEEDSDAVGLIEKIMPDQIVQVNDLIGECQKAGNWDDKAGLVGYLKPYEIEDLADLPQGQVINLLADLERTKNKKKPEVRK